MSPLGWSPPPSGVPWSRTDTRRQQQRINDRRLWITTTAPGATSYTITGTDDLVLVDASAGFFSLHLGPASERVRTPITVKKIDASANNVNITGGIADTIDGAGNILFSTQYQSYTIVSDGTTWWII